MVNVLLSVKTQMKKHQQFQYKNWHIPLHFAGDEGVVICYKRICMLYTFYFNLHIFDFNYTKKN